MKAFILSLQFLTRLPLPWMIEGEDDLFARGMKYFPIAGLIIGCFELLAFYLVGLVLPRYMAALFTVLTDVLITGGLHIDGLADSADALTSHRDREKMLEIMKDSRIGTFGLLGVVFVLALRWSCYAALPELAKWYEWGILLVVPVCGRTTMALLLYVSEYARKEGMGGLFFSYKSSMNLPVALILGVLFCCAAGFYGAGLMAVSLAVGLLFRGYCYRRIGGMTGDTLGASLELAEVCSLFAALLMLKAAAYWGM